MENDALVKKQVKKNTILWIALLTEFLIAFLVSYFVLVPEEPIRSDNISHQYLLYFSYMFVILAIPGAYYVFDRKVKSLKTIKSFTKKADSYFFAFIIKYVLFEFAGIFAIIAYVITERNEPLYMFAVVVIAILINKPSIFRFNKDVFKEEEENNTEYDYEEIEEGKDDIEQKPEISIKDNDLKINLN